MSLHRLLNQAFLGTLAACLLAIALSATPTFAQSTRDDDESSQSENLAGPAAAALGSAEEGDEDEAVVDQRSQEGETVRVTVAQARDYAANEESDVFGAQLFTGAFAAQSPAAFNPDYAINVGDRIQIRLWGAYTFQSVLTVDENGNIFLPNVGPVNVLGVTNSSLQTLVERAVATTFRSNVFVYARLDAAQPVRVYVGGFVNRPGAYAGTSMDSVLHYLDMAGGVDPERGSFINIVVKRGGEVRSRLNLYDFLLRGNMPQVQFNDGDVIFVEPRRATVEVQGNADNANIFEFEGESISLLELGRMAKPRPFVTNVRVTRSQGEKLSVEYYSVLDAPNIEIYDGDVVSFTADKRPGTITVRVEGEHDSPQEYVLPYGARLGEVLSQLQFTPLSAPSNISLSRESVKERQQRLLNTSLDALEQAALTARSGTRDESALRSQEAERILQWVERARLIEPRGQVVISNSSDRNDLVLENGDILTVPTKDGIVVVSGAVQFPNAVAFNPDMAIDDYAALSGGFAPNADKNRIIVVRQDGSFAEGDDNSNMLDFGTHKAPLEEGDEILVMPRVNSANRQIFKEITQILYQIAVSAGVVLRF
ncbi:polysaccharide biosynthesis/export family protein [Croceicoccus gelatinilyticus]|uniref:polysaccharide biosynthesis/export family protein n=1 Tax=Croceicoccus gelatinilyticus TaxID=2835536 RepID=UPI001BD1B1D9|nr:polysaccharide biosynthesis/export family protein [Croceicoccus gelatinilyticus]MBS7671195.1 polysaccharide biosynthesis/export family protein [Croceicoccus gelatinilyticus]